MKRPSATVFAAAAAAAAALGATAWHLARNVAPPSWDDAWYLETSFRLFSALQAGPLAFVSAYLEAFRIKAPLISLLPLPLYALFGAGERVAVWVNLPLAALSAWGWSRAAAAWWREHPFGREAAALAGALAALLPISYGLSRYFLVETLLTALLGLWAWRCAAARGDDRAEGVRLGVLLGLGLLAKVTFPLLAAGLAWPARARLKPHAKTVLLLGGAIAATWYVENLPYVLGFAWKASFGKEARDYLNYLGSGTLAAPRWAMLILSNGLSWPLAAVMTFSAALAAGGARREGLDAGTRAALWGLAPLLVFMASFNPEPRLAAPLLPLLGVLAARSAVSWPGPAARATAAAALLATGLVVCADQTFRAGGALAYNGPPSSDAGWDRGALVDAVAASGGRIAAVALEHPRLNANNLSSLAAARGPGLRFVNLGYAQISAEAALIRLKEKGATTLVFVSGLPARELPAFLNRANSGVAEAVGSGRLPAQLAARVALAPGVSAEVFGLVRAGERAP